MFYFVAATISPLQRRALSTKTKSSSEGQIQFAFYTAAVVSALSLLLPIFSPFRIVGDWKVLFILAIASGLFGAGYWIAIFTAQKHVEAGITTMVMNIYTPVTIIIASIFLNEKLTLVQVFGTILLLAGMLVVSKQHRTGRFRFDRNIMLVLLGGILLGLMLSFERILLKTTGFTSGTMLSWAAQCLCLGFAVLITKSRCNYSVKEVLATGGFRFLQSLSWVTLLVVVGNMSVVSSITTFKVVLIFIAAAIFLHERQDLSRKIIGSIVASVGLLMMI